MLSNFLFLCLQTLFLWGLVVQLYHQKKRYTLIPLYALLTLSTFIAQHFNDLGLVVKIYDLTFLIGSFSFFTTTIFATLLLYLFEGPRAARTALWVIVMTTMFYVGLVYFIDLQLSGQAWITPDISILNSNIWSILAIVIDILLLGVGWEILSKVKKIPLILKVFLIMLLVFVLDTIIYVSGVFAASRDYFSILEGSLSIRVALALIATPVMTTLLKFEGYSEEKRTKPQNFWEILNFKSDLEIKIFDLESTLEKSQALEKNLKAAQDTYELVINGAGAGVWELDIKNNSLIYSPKFLEMLGYNDGELGTSTQDFSNLVHPEERESAIEKIMASLKNGNNFTLEYRLRHKDGEYHWYQLSGTVKNDRLNQPIKGAGTIIDIEDRKQAEFKILEQIGELTRLNKIMVDRELKMVELKQKLKQLNQPK